jgi:hypothetical protein
MPRQTDRMPSGPSCPGCGLALAQPDADVGEPAGSSAACWSVHLEVAAFEVDHPVLLAGHQLLVDAYGAQHAGPGSIRLPYSLVGLQLALDHGWTGPAVRALHGRMGKPRPDWPTFERPPSRGAGTILDVATAGARSGSLAGHEASLRAWAEGVWSAWSSQRAAVTALAARFL